jgi:hypothetical protein
LPFDGPIRIVIGAASHIIGRTLAAAVNVDSVERGGES